MSLKKQKKKSLQIGSYCNKKRSFLKQMNDLLN
jgi:hypothetical protein